MHKNEMCLLLSILPTFQWEESQIGRGSSNYKLTLRENDFVNEYERTGVLTLSHDIVYP